MIVILLQQSRINLLLLDLAINGVGPAFFHHHSGDAGIAFPNGKVRNRCLRWQSEQVFPFKRLRDMTVENLQNADASVLVVNQHVHFHHLQRECR